MTVRKSRIAAILFLIALTGLLLTGCGCEHEWQKATCQAPRTCIRCGETEGKIRSHEWGNTACNAPEGCVVCGTLEGIEYTHEWREDCKICVHCGHDERPAEDRFPDMLAAGLQERWQLEAQLQERETAPEGEETEPYVRTREDWENLFAAEYTRIAPFKQEKFQDEAMEAAALRYIGSIEASVDALEHFGTDQWEDEYFNGAYWEQANALYLVNALRPISVAEEHQETLTDLLINGEIINMVRPLLDQVMFLHVGTNNAGKKYETTIKNTTSLNFEWFSLDVNLLDEDGKIMDTETVKVITWKPDQRKRFNFTTDQEFSGIEVAFANWKLPSRWQ